MEFMTSEDDLEPVPRSLLAGELGRLLEAAIAADDLANDIPLENLVSAVLRAVREDDAVALQTVASWVVDTGEASERLGALRALRLLAVRALEPLDQPGPTSLEPS